METTAARPPLVPKNSVSGIPRPCVPPSRLPQPTAVKKRPASEMGSTVGKENTQNPPKRAKLDNPAKPPAAKTNSKLATTRTAVAKTTKTVPKGKPTSVASSMRSTSAKPAPSTSKCGPTKAPPGGSKVAAGAGKQKRAPWDLKGRLQDMEVQMADQRQNSNCTIGDLSIQLSRLAERIEDMEQLKTKHEGKIRVQEEERTATSSQIKVLGGELQETKQKLLETTRSYEHEVEILKLSKSALQRSHDQLEADLAVSRREATSLKSTVAQMAADASAIQCQLEATKVARDQAIADSNTKSREIAALKEEVERHLHTITECRQRILDDETLRRKLHNTIQELKGNIRVFCRVRPLLPSEGGLSLNDSTLSRESTGSAGSGGARGSGGRQTALQIDYPDQEREGKRIALLYSNSESSAGKAYDFEFDQVFAPGSTQVTVFEEISQLVQSALDGYNVCIFAYGQTGSGKTYTMEGPEGRQHETRGMIPRAVEQVFATAIFLREKGWEYKMEASFVEIYNETLRDLLGNTDTKLEIKIDPNQPSEIYVTNLSLSPVTSEAQVARLLERAAKNRAVAATLCNDRSSRSHSVFRLKLTGRNKKTGETCQGMLNLVDLAGSERLSQSGSTGERLRETKNINKSLSNLGNVIMALANKEQHIPYRNSKLTYLLQNSLGGNSKTLMFVNVSPLPTSFQETLCSLRFATKVNQCNIGTATKIVK